MARKNRDISDYEYSEYEDLDYGHPDFFEYEGNLQKNSGKRLNLMKSPGRDVNRKSGKRRKRNNSSTPLRLYDEEYYRFDDDL